MKYRYIAIFSIKGLTQPPDGRDTELVIDSRMNLRAILTSQPNIYSFERDRGLVVAGLMMRGLFQREPIGQDFQQRVTNAIEELWAARQREFGKAPWLVVVAEGEVASFTPSHERETDDFVFCFDGADKSQIRDRYRPSIAALINSITSVAESVTGVRKAADGVVFFREDGKPVYSYTESPLPLTGYKSKPLLHEDVGAIRSLYRCFAADRTFERVQRLLQFSFQTEQDTLRCFLAAWSAFEVFVNRAFRTYECAFFTSLLQEGQPDAQKRYLERIRNVMKDKCRLVDKFAAISFQLSPNTADDDLKTVSHAKRIRDNLFHGESVDEAILPGKAIRDVARKYLRLHVSSAASAKAAGTML